MRISLILCTYMRPDALSRLLESIQDQSVYPDEILVVDGSTDDKTMTRLKAMSVPNLIYHKVPDEERGLTRQRNFGLKRFDRSNEIVCFLDDDTILDRNYFKEILRCFKENEDAVGVGGVAVNENRWTKNLNENLCDNVKYYCLDGYIIKESSRNVLRNRLGLQSDSPPSVMPKFSHGRTYSYPLTGKSYPVDLMVGMSMSFKASVFENIEFSRYFEGYGLYEDADFCIRALQCGQNYIATAARLEHHHDSAGRPNTFRYGKMVLRNGWYVWRVKYPKIDLKNRLKWNAVSFVLTLVRLGNVVTGPDRMAAFREVLGRTVGWFSLIFNKPKRV